MTERKKAENKGLELSDDCLSDLIAALKGRADGHLQDCRLPWGGHHRDQFIETYADLLNVLNTYVSQVPDFADKDISDGYTPALLKGLLYGPDGAAFSPTHTRKGGELHRCYVSQTILKHRAGSCPVGWVPAGETEAAVIDQPEIVAGTWKAVPTLNREIADADARATLQQLDPLWDQLFPAEQARIVTLLVERIDIGTDILGILLRIDGLAGGMEEFRTDRRKAA